MNLSEGASAEILTRWPDHKQRNVALNPDTYGTAYRAAMLAGIELVRQHHAQLEAQGATAWSCPPELTALLDQLAGTPTAAFTRQG